MKVNFRKFFKDHKGQEMKHLISDEVAKILFSLGSADKAPLTADEKYMAYKLCNLISMSEGEVVLTTDEASFIIRMCGEHLTAGAYGQVRDLIENNN